MGMGRIFSVGTGLTTEQDKLALSWSSPEKREANIEIQLSLNWTQAAQEIDGRQTIPPALVDPYTAGQSVRTRLRWSTGGMSRDTGLDTPNALGTALPQGFTGASIGARGAIYRLRASQVDMWVGPCNVSNRTTVLASLSDSSQAPDECRTLRAAQDSLYLSAVGGGSAFPNAVWAPPFSHECRLASECPHALVTLYAPDLATVLDRRPVSNFFDWRSLHSGVVMLTCDLSLSSGTYKSFRAEFR